MLAWGLGRYAGRRRRVYRGGGTPELWPNRGIAAGSAFATTELWLLLCCSMGRLIRQFAEVQFCLHVDDLTGTVDGDEDEEIIEKILEVVEAVKQELTQECAMQLSDSKAACTATSLKLAAAVAARIGNGEDMQADVVVRKLGVDYSSGPRRWQEDGDRLQLLRRPSPRGLWCRVTARGNSSGTASSRPAG